VGELMLSTINKGAAYTVAAIIGFLGTLAFMASGSLWALPLILGGPTLAVLIHELGHAFAAWRCGMNVRAIAVGPLELRTRPIRFHFSERIFGEDIGGHVRYDESFGRYLTRRTDALITAAGPIANLLSALICFMAAAQFGDTVLGRLTIGFAYTSLAAFALSAWPFHLQSGRGNDALEIVRMLRRERAPMRFGKPKRSPWQAP
jgi:hypothetical protein